MQNLNIIGVLLLLCSCQSSFLDVRPSTQTVVPTTLKDLGLLLKDEGTFRSATPNTMNLFASDEYYLSELRYNAFEMVPTTSYQRNAFTWEKVIYTGEETTTDWSNGYKRILQCNVVLDGLEKINPSATEVADYNYIKGSALFHRAFAYYYLAQVYCPVYRGDVESENTLGLPLRKVADPTVLTGRSTLRDTYRFIEEDLLTALELIPEKVLQVSKTDPTRMACRALLTRLYMQKGDYLSAEKFAKDGLAAEYVLIDYGGLPVSNNSPFPVNGKGNAEIIFMNSLPSLAILSESNQIISSELLALYHATDLRLPLFYKDNKGIKIFKGSLSGTSNSPFTGLALDELYLNLSECLARRGEEMESIRLLNDLRKNWFKPEDFLPYKGLNADEILLKVLEERRRQLVFRGIRWEDLRRLNKEDRFKQTLIRKVGSKEFRLAPESLRWTWPIPPPAIINGGYEQNPRD